MISYYYRRHPRGYKIVSITLISIAQNGNWRSTKRRLKLWDLNKSGQKLKSHKFKLNDSILQNVTQYKYLGFILAASGTCSHGINNLIDRSKRAWFSIYSILAKSKNKALKTYITLFEYVVKPIMLYGCEVWGAFTV